MESTMQDYGTQTSIILDTRTTFGLGTSAGPIIVSEIFNIQVITIPRSNMGDAYYKSKLNVYNLTVYELGVNQGNCYTWSEDQLSPGLSDIALAVALWLQEVDQRGAVETVELYSDSTVSQNRNQPFSAMLIHFLTRAVNITKITHKYFNPGHSLMEADGMHGIIQKNFDRLLAQRHHLYTPRDIQRVMREAISTKPYTVKELSHEDNRNYKDLSEDLIGPLHNSFAGIMKSHLINYEKVDDGSITMGGHPQGVDRKKHKDVMELVDMLSMGIEERSLYTSLCVVKFVPFVMELKRLECTADRNPATFPEPCHVYEYFMLRI